MRVDDSRIRKEKVADSKISGYVWTGPKFNIRMSQLIVQIYKLLRAASRAARLCDILVLFVARCTPVKSGEFVLHSIYSS